MTTSTSPPSAIEWAREHGRPFDWVAQIGASPKSERFGKAWYYEHPVPGIGLGVLVEEAKAIPNAHQAIYTIDDPASAEVTLWFCAGWHDEQDVMFLHPVSEGVLSGPERCYHLRVVAP